MVTSLSSSQRNQELSLAMRRDRGAWCGGWLLKLQLAQVQLEVGSPDAMEGVQLVGGAEGEPGVRVAPVRVAGLVRLEPGEERSGPLGRLEHDVLIELHHGGGVIVHDVDVLHGQARIRGTRIPVSLVLGCLAEGMTEEEILQQYPTLTVEGIRAAAAYAAELTDEQILPLSGQ